MYRDLDISNAVKTQQPRFLCHEIKRFIIESGVSDDLVSISRGMRANKLLDGAFFMDEHVVLAIFPTPLGRKMM